MVGQWQCSRTEELLNIFDETPLRMKASYPCPGHHSCEPNCVYEKDSFPCWEINDEKYRMVYYVKLERVSACVMQFLFFVRLCMA